MNLAAADNKDFNMTAISDILTPSLAETHRKPRKDCHNKTNKLYIMIITFSNY